MGVSVCVCVRERHRDRESGGGGGDQIGMEEIATHSHRGRLRILI